MIWHVRRKSSGWRSEFYHGNQRVPDTRSILSHQALYNLWIRVLDLTIIHNQPLEEWPGIKTMYPLVKFLCSLLKSFHFSPAVESFHQPTSSVSSSTSHDGSIPEHVGRGTWFFEDSNRRCHVMSFFGTSGVDFGYLMLQLTC